MTTTTAPTTTLSAAARAEYERTEGEPFLVNDWDRAVFLHYEVDPDLLQKQVPFALDLYEGRAYVSLVAFTMRHLKLNSAGRIIDWLTSPAANQGFLNVRTYIRHHEAPAIYFLAEWLTNRLSVFFGPRTYGLPFRYGVLDYRHVHEVGRLRGRVTPADAPQRLTYRIHVDPDAVFAPCEQGGLDEFVLERYTAYTKRGFTERRFRIWHEPWPQIRVEPTTLDDSLIHATGPWAQSARFLGAHYTPGVTGVWMSRPRCTNGPASERAWPLPFNAKPGSRESHKRRS